MNDLINIENKILVIRGQQVMLDRDLAELYGVETKVLNQAVKRNIERFPDWFLFQLNKEEAESCSKSQFVTLNASGNYRGQNIKKLPYAFTEHGVAMLSAVLRSPTAIQVSIKIMRAFVAMRHFLRNNSKIFTEIDSIKHHLIESDLQHKEHENRIDTLFNLMDKYKIEDKQGIFFQGQIYDAYSFFQKLIQKAKKDIILIDNYIDITVLDRFTQKNPNVNVCIYTNPKSKIPTLTLQKFNSQYPTLSIKSTASIHDRFLILDNTEIYHIGASIKDLGKKCFAFEKMADSASVIQEVRKRV